MRKIIQHIKNTIADMQVSVSTYYKFKISLDIVKSIITLIRWFF